MSEVAGLKVVFDADVSMLTRASDKAGDSLVELQKKTSSTETKLKNLKTTTGTSSNAVLNLGRIAQDASFGFIGIANNIEPFIQSLGSLKNTAGSAKGAFSAFFSSLAGPAGIGVLIGGISLLDAYSKGYGIFSNRVKEASKAQSDAAKNAAESAQTEAASIRLLASVAADASFSMGQRTRAVDELQSKYPEYLGNLSKEQILTGQITKEVEGLSNALLNKSLAQATSGTIGKLAQQLDDAKVALSNAIDKELEKNGSIKTPSFSILDAFLTVSKLPTFDSPIEKATIAVNQLEDEIGKAFERQKSYAKLAGDLFLTSAKATTESTKEIEKNTIAVNKGAEAYAAWQTQKRKLSTGGIVDASDVQKAVPDTAIKANVPILRIPIKLLLPPKDEVTESLTFLREQVSKTSADIFSGVAESFGSGKGLKGIFGSIMQTLGEGFKTIGKAMIEAAPLVVALQELFTKPVAGLVGGIAFVALGSFLQSQVPKLATGGIVTSPQQAIIGESGPEAVIPLGRVPSLFGDGGGGVFEFVIQGNNLRTVINRANERALKIG